ncbi:hypothetical protein MKZ38_007160 [Zalerion maritima]|uniref:BZIP domain-containing protein n=1 Tax=Zalerion maritima TaxID=339359 RepID=A0AAD5RV08_9PEZI|nr:hypothetical protein MKZ38_007160 [Zalerion maritima]
MDQQLLGQPEPHIRILSEDWHGITDQTKRRKLQNRLNQREYRRRRRLELLEQQAQNQNETQNQGQQQQPQPQPRRRPSHRPTHTPARQQIDNQHPHSENNDKTHSNASIAPLLNITSSSSSSTCYNQPALFTDFIDPPYRSSLINVAARAHAAYLSRNPIPAHLPAVIKFNVFAAVARNSTLLNLGHEWLFDDHVLSPFGSGGLPERPGAGGKQGRQIGVGVVRSEILPPGTGLQLPQLGNGRNRTMPGLICPKSKSKPKPQSMHYSSASSLSQLAQQHDPILWGDLVEEEEGEGEGTPEDEPPTQVQTQRNQPSSSLSPYHQSSIPPSLHPTPLQLTIPHHPWLDLLPYPAMRDALIQYSVNSSPAEWERVQDDLCDDLCDVEAELEACDAAGSVADGTGMGLAGSGAKSGAAEEAKGPAAALALSGPRFIVWGESHDPFAWEVSQEFVTKWGWIVKGCDDLRKSTDAWRARRGESGVVWEV